MAHMQGNGEREPVRDAGALEIGFGNGPAIGLHAHGDVASRDAARKLAARLRGLHAMARRGDIGALSRLASRGLAVGPDHFDFEGARVRFRANLLGEVEARAVAIGLGLQRIVGGTHGVEAKAIGFDARHFARVEPARRCGFRFRGERAEVALQAHLLLQRGEIEERGAHREALHAQLLGDVGARGGV